MTVTQVLPFGESAGHPFRGNQWKSGEAEDGAQTERSAAPDPIRAGMNTTHILEEMVKGRVNENDVIGLPIADQPSYITDEERGKVKDEIVSARGADIAKAAETNEALASQLFTIGKEFPPYESSYKHEDGTSLNMEDRLAVQWQVEQWRTSVDYTGVSEGWKATAYEQGPLITSARVTTDQVLAVAHDNPDCPSPIELVSKDMAQQYIDNWAGTACDGKPESLAMQSMVADTLNGQSSSFDEYLAHGVGDRASLTSEAFLESQGEIMTAFIDAQYTATQEWLREQGIKENDQVTLYRGMSLPGDVGHLSTEKVDLNPASSWSVSRETARQFAETRTSVTGHEQGYLLTMNVPAHNIISTSLTGQGAIIEAEVLIHNTPDNIVHLEAPRAR